MKSRNLLFFFILLIIISQSACTTSNKNLTPNAKTSQITSIAGWDITIDKFTNNENLNNASTSLGYTGNTNTVEYSATPRPGYIFCLVQMKLTKVKSNEEFSWDKLVLRDQNGIEYKREDDVNIQDLGFNRLPDTNLNSGTNEGWIAFQIYKTAVSLTLEYPFIGETFTYKLK